MPLMSAPRPAERARRSSAPHTRMRHERSGFTLVELLVVLVMIAIVGGALSAALSRQQRFYRGASEVMDVRAQLKGAVDIISADLRGISAAGGDIYAGGLTSTSLEFRSTFGSSTACRIVGGNQIYLPPNVALAAGNRLTHLGRRPMVGNGVFLLDEGATTASNDDSWALRHITAVADNVNPCTGTTFTGAGDVAKTGLLITLDAALPATVLPGASVRLVSRVKYELFTGGDGRAYLGYCESNDIGTACAANQVVAGPFRGVQADGSLGTGGLNFYYFDENGNVTADRLQVARVDLAVRGISTNWVSRSGEAAKGEFLDTARVSVGVRNRR